MRVVFSLAALLLVVYLVSQMAGTQLQAFKSPPGGAAPAGAAVSPADAVAEQVRKALEQSAAAAEAAVQKADDAASR